MYIVSDTDGILLLKLKRNSIPVVSPTDYDNGVIYTAVIAPGSYPFV